MRYATGERRRRIRPPLRVPTTSGAPHRARPAPRGGKRRAAGYREPTEAPAALRYRYV